MRFKYIYDCKTIRAFNRLRQRASKDGVYILASRKNMVILSEYVINTRDESKFDVYSVRIVRKKRFGKPVGKKPDN